MYQSSALLIRTHFLNEALVGQIQRYQKYFGDRVAVCVDESKGIVPAIEQLDGVTKISMTYSRLAHQKLYPHCHKSIFWKCGDYCYYLAKDWLKSVGVDNAWLVESDVFMQTDNVSALFDFMDKSPADLIVNRLRPAPNDWTPASVYENLHRAKAYQCFFPLSRLSVRAIEFLFALRQRATATMLRKGLPQNHWPNDESFVASSLAQAGFVCANLKDLLAGSVGLENFHLNGGKKFSISDLPTSVNEEQILHPVQF